ncbi:cysteine--tRNA ligase [Alphaproteobacteria bacterium]|nr:cysteine--tRNA ligase [Alphaproteobacteria bacterium]
MMLKLYNTASKSVEIFKPLDEKQIKMYVCGPTVYNYAHIGNARPAVIFDVLYRLLKKIYPKVIYVRNITDVDDKINEQAKKSGISIAKFTEFYIEAYQKDMKSLNVLPPDIEPKATDHIEEIISMIKRLKDLGNAYEVDGHVLFDVSSFNNYGELSRLDKEELISGARVEVAEYKKNPEDFTLWKPSSKDLPGWQSPWGFGRPGWHIECSTMVEKHLGKTIDIHGGGQDLIFPHHENEIAQSTCANSGENFCKTWVHNGFVTVEGKKMSKSLGNIILTKDLINNYTAAPVRLALLNAHYRQPLDWSSKTLEQTSKSLKKLVKSLSKVEHIKEKIPTLTSIDKKLMEDLNTPSALAELFNISKKIHHTQNKEQLSFLKGELIGGLDILGLLGNEKTITFREQSINLDKEYINNKILKRNIARKNNNYKEADLIRNELYSEGIILEDSAKGTTWKLK